MIIDTPTNVAPYIPTLLKNGVTDVIRYFDRFAPAGSWKQQASAAEAHALAAAGMGLGIVYEHGAAPSGYSLGYADACYSLARALDIGMPSGAGIYYAVDHDIVSSEMSGVLQYFAGIAQAHKENQTIHLRIGCYGSGYLNSMLLSIYPNLLPWITCSTGFQGSQAFLNAGRQALWQQHCGRNLNGLDIDINVAHWTDWGQFIPFGKQPPPPPVPPPIHAWPTNAGAQDGLASWYADSTNADQSPVNNTTDMTCAHLYLAFGTAVKATRRDTGKSCVVTCHDRGPYMGGRIIDFRPAAARALDMINAGIAPIHLELA